MSKRNPSLFVDPGLDGDGIKNHLTNNKNSGYPKIIRSVFHLKNIRTDLMEDDIDQNNIQQDEVVYVELIVEKVTAQIMIDTGASISIINKEELQRINQVNQCEVPTLPVSNMTFMGATGKLNKTLKHQVLLEVGTNEVTSKMVFYVAENIPFTILIGCDLLKEHFAIIDMSLRYVRLFIGGATIQVRFMEAQCAPVPCDSPHHVNSLNKNIGQPIVACPNNNNFNNNNNVEWESKVKEIVNYQNATQQPTIHEKEQLIKIYQHYQKVFSDQPGCAKYFECKLRFKEGVAFNKKSYPIPQKHKALVRAEIQKMVNEEIIEPSQSPYTSPLLATPKKDGSIRLCLDAREINKMLINDRTSPGEIAEIMKKFHGTQHISTWDATCGYWQIALEPNSRPYVAFIFEGRNFQFTRLPFGLINSVAVFIHCMDQVLGVKALEFTTVYVDDILITSNSWEEHCYRVEYVLNKLQQHGITLKLDKSKLITNQVKFLGYILSPLGITSDPEKISVIQNFPSPKNLKQLQSFLGICNYYRQFQQNYSHLTSQLQPQLSKKNVWSWKQKQEEIFQRIKEKFLESIVLKHPNFDKIFYMNCDASNISVGAELYQEDEAHNHLVISFASRTLNKAEQGYNTTEKELLSVVFACCKFRTYILGYPIVVRSDHKSISFLKKCRLSHGRITRWILTLQEYDITWEFVPGKENIIADTLSRINTSNPEYTLQEPEIHKVFTILENNNKLTDIISKLEREQHLDGRLKSLIEKAEAADCENQYYQLINNILFTRSSTEHNHWKVAIPATLEVKLINYYHEEGGHMGVIKVIKALEEHCNIKSINRKVRNVLRACDICQKTKIDNINRTGINVPIVSKDRLEKVFIDICGPLPSSGGNHRYKHIIILFDHFTKFTKLYPISRAITKNILKVITDKFIPEVGIPSTIVSDHGTQFRGSLWKNHLSNLNIRTYKTARYHPQSNPAERVLRETGRILRTYCYSNHKNWSKYVKMTEEYLNYAYHESIKMTPIQAMTGETPKRKIEDIINFPIRDVEEVTTVQIYNNMLAQREKKVNKDKKNIRRAKPFNINDQVLMKNHQLASTELGLMKKLLLIYVGPFVITSIKGPNTYEISSLQGKKKGTYNQKDLKLYYH